MAQLSVEWHHPWQVDLGYIRKQAKHGPMSEHDSEQAASLHSFCFRFLPWLSSVMDYDLKMEGN